MKILVTGGAGFIGSHVVDHLLNAGHSVDVVDNLITGARENLNPKAIFHHMDITTPDIVTLFERVKPEAVYHLAAQMNVSASVENPLFDATTNILGTIRLLEASIRNGVRRFVFSSSGGTIYGAPAILPATEETPAAPVSPYAASKLAAEEYIKMYSRAYGMTYVILRYSNVFGPRQIPHGECGVCAVLADLMLKGKIPTLYGFGKPVRDYVYVDDVARANVLALEKGAHLTINISSGVGTTVNELFEVLREVIGFTEEPLRKELRPGEVESNICANAFARTVFGWEPRIGLLEGLRNTIHAART
ncbi:MAG: NAD-dependent epimerase/dehydratase family protein [Candidatus Hydrogenedentes bacterium]|nr:NAD-dependent epimerase/dehydratase family protein [Candidatus Hydrogenedentota bacterium]